MAPKAEPALLEPHDEPGSRRPGRLPGRHRRRSQRPPGQDRGHGDARRLARHQGPRAPGRDVRIRHDPAHPDPGPGRVFHGICPVRNRAARGPGADHRPDRGPDRLRDALDGTRQGGHDGKGEIRENETARERGDDRAHRPRQDDADGGDHEGAGDQGTGDGQELRRRGQGGRQDVPAGRDEDPDGGLEPRGIRVGAAALRAHRLPGPRRLHQEHDLGRGPDGRVDAGGVGGRRADAADAGAHPAGAAGERAGHRGLHEQVRPGGRPGDPGPGGAGGAGASDEVRVPRGHDADHPRLGDGGAGGSVGRGRQADLGAGQGPGHVHSGAAAGSGQAVPDVDRGRLHDHGPRARW